MNTRIKYAVILAVVLPTAAPVLAAGGELDGKTFKGKIWAEGDPADPDTFIFNSGTFRSTACDEYGYESAPYTVTSKDGVKTFTSTTKNSGGATMLWQGTLKGNEIEGSAVMTDKAGEKTPMKFAGKVE